MHNSKKEKQSNPNHIRTVYLVNIIFLCFLTLAAIGGGIFLFLRYRQARKDLADIHQEMTATAEHAQTLYTDEEVEQLVSEAREQASDDARRELLQDMQSSLETGESVLMMLRQMFPDNFVVSASDKYYFYPILRNVRTNPYSDQDFALDDKGRMQYKGSDSSVSPEFGIDVSASTGEIDWEAVASDGVDFAMIRLGGRDENGTLFLDSSYADNLEQAEAAGIETGVYIKMSDITDDEASEDAAFVLQALEEVHAKVEGPVAVVVTPPSQDSRAYGQSRAAWTSHVKTFLDAVSQGGRDAVIYSNATGFAIMLDLTQLDDTERWISDKSGSLYFPYRFEYWQYGTGEVDGIDGRVNLDLRVETGD